MWNLVAEHHLAAAVLQTDVGVGREADGGNRGVWLCGTGGSPTRTAPSAALRTSGADDRPATDDEGGIVAVEALFR